MTEAEWLACENPLQAIRYPVRYQFEITERKWRLVACAFCRFIWHLLPDDLSRSTVETCECYVDGLADPQPLFARPLSEKMYAEGTVESEAFDAALAVGFYLEVAGRTAEEDAAWGACYHALRASELAGQPESQVAPHFCHLIRDVIGRTLHPVAFIPNWRTDTTNAIARQMYESRDFSAMPILADALQDAGCDNAEVLTHCRDETATHVRGCWVIDGALGL